MAKDKSNQNNAIIEMNILDQQLRQLEEHARKVEQQVYEQQFMELSLEEMKGKNNSEVMIPLGPGLFIPGKIENTDKVLIHIGGKIISRKSVDEARKIIEKRKESLMQEGEKVGINMQKILEEMTVLESKIRNLQSQNRHQHHGECGDECECD